MTEPTGRIFGELPAALVDELLSRAGELSNKLLNDFHQLQEQHNQWRNDLQANKLLASDAEVAHPTIPTTCGIDGAYAVERLLSSDLVAAAAVAVEGLTPPSETRYWPEPRHRAWVQPETHHSDTGTVLRALMIGYELQLAVEAPHQIVMLDGSLTTPLIYFNQALNKSKETGHLQTTHQFIEQILTFLEAYRTVLTSLRSDRSWIGLPKYTTRREVGQYLQWSSPQDDRSLLSFLLKPSEYTKPIALQQPTEPWHLNLAPLTGKDRADAELIQNDIVSALNDIHVVYYRPSPWLPALRVEMAQSIATNRHRLAELLWGVRHQCVTAAVLEPYPLYMADRMVKHVAMVMPTLRQVASQQMAEAYRGDINDVFIGLHSYRTESGV